MAGAVTLSTLRTRIRQRADQEFTGSDFITDTELNQLINTSYAELYGHLVRNGIDIAESSQTITSTGATTPYALASDFYSILNVYRYESGRYYRLPRHDIRVKPSDVRFGKATSYRVVGVSLQLNPWPSTGDVIKVTYVPVPSDLSADTDAVDGVLGWEEFLVWDVAAKIAMKEESDARPFLVERDRILERIKDEAQAAEMVESYVIATNRDDSFADLTDSDLDGRGYRGPLAGYGKLPW